MTAESLSDTLRDAIHQRIDDIDPVTLLRYSYVPFCVAEGIWDYADSLVLQAIMIGRPETKRISRAVRSLRRSYEKKRARAHNAQYTHDECAEGELENYLGVEDADREFFQKMRSSIYADIHSQYPDLDADNTYLVSGVYQCRAILQALFAYVRQQSEIIRQRLSLPFIADILPSEMYALYDVIIQYAGDKRIQPSGISAFAEELASRLSSTEFIDIPQNLLNNQQS